MQATEKPPTYSEYPTELPDGFPIAGTNVQPLVNVTELQAHLRLLGAIHKLKQTVQAQEEGIAAKNKDQAWVVFVNRAVHRFYVWASATWSRGSPGLNEAIIPPLDVVMVWHSYLLNPQAYYEDSQRMDTKYCANLQTIQSMPLTLVSSLIDVQTLEAFPPSTERQSFWETTTSLPFAPPLVTGFSDVITLDCPLCLQKNHQVKWISDDEKGFAQPGFEYTCDTCHDVFNKSNVGVRRFTEEVTRRRAGEKVYLSETLLEPRTGKVDTRAADAFTTKVLKHLDDKFKISGPVAPNRIRLEASILAAMVKYDSNTLSIYLHKSVRPDYAPSQKPTQLPRIQRLATAYSNAGLASLDLVGAVLRQGTFVDKMVQLGWTRPGRFDQAIHLAPLVRSIARYHAFLDLMSCHPTSFLVPTLDIDLAWHSHQLKGEGYRNDTMNYLARTPNHEDSVESSTLSTGYDITARIWKERFGVPYSLCGCAPDPGENEKPRRSHFASKIKNILRKPKEENPAPSLVNTRPDLVTLEDDEAGSSHPSEHNTEFGDPKHLLTVYKTYARVDKTTEHVANAGNGVPLDPWRALQADRREKRIKQTHREAFTDSTHGYGQYYPYWGVSMAVPFGFYGGFAYTGAHYGGCGSGCAAGCREAGNNTTGQAGTACMAGAACGGAESQDSSRLWSAGDFQRSIAVSGPRVSYQSYFGGPRSL